MVAARGSTVVLVFFAVVLIAGIDGCLRSRYDDAAEAYEEGLRTSPGDEALSRGLEDVLKAQAASVAPPGGSCMVMA